MADISQRATLVRPDSEQPLRMARRSTDEIFRANKEESLTLCETKDLDYSISTGRESLRKKMTK